MEVTTTFLKKWSDKIQRPVSVLPTVSKFLERLMHKQMSNFVEKILSVYMCGFRKGFSTQKALLFWLKHGKKYLIKRDMGVQYSYIYQRPLMQ